MSNGKECDGNRPADLPKTEDGGSRTADTIVANWNAEATRQSDKSTSPERQPSPEEEAERRQVFLPEEGVGFGFGSPLPAAGHMDRLVASITPEQREGIRNGTLRLTITGLASRVGDAASNQELSEARSANVAWQLANKLGVDPARIHHEGLGEEIARIDGSPDDKDNCRDRIALIDIAPVAESAKTERLAVSDQEASKVVDRFLEPMPMPAERDLGKEAKDGLFNPTSLWGVLKFGIKGTERWLESNETARLNFAASANFIPAFLGSIESLTTGTTRFAPLQSGSGEALLGRRTATEQFAALTDADRVKLVAALNDDRQRPGLLKQMEMGLRRRFVLK